jgi:hypothetical protein
MSLVTGEITDDGPLIDVLVGVSKNRRQALERVGHPVPANMPVRAILDTGSHGTGFLPTLFAFLDITPFGTIPVRTPTTKPGQPCICDLYDVSVTLLSGMTPTVLPSIHAIASEDFDKEEGSVQALIGRDILGRCVFTYYGPHRTFSLAF